MTARKHDAARLVLSMEGIAISEGWSRTSAHMYGDLVLQAGELGVVEVARREQASVWADAMLGLHSPTRGHVRFLDNDWSTLDPEMCNVLRARTGRVFGYGNWLDDLSVLDNILLPGLHHSERSADELRAEAAALARALGMPGVPIGMPRSHGPADLQRAACVRAFLGNPLLIVLEEPVRHVGGELLAPLVNVIRTCRDRGAAVAWFSAGSATGHAATLPASRRYRLVGDVLVEVSRQP